MLETWVRLPAGRLLLPPLATALLISLSGACGQPDGGARDPSFAVVRDSAGLEIVENSAPVFSGEASWTLEPEPSLQIGSVDGDADEALYRVSDATRLSDGTVAVVNAGVEIRFFDPEGGFVRTVGRRGDGPGEFRLINHFERLPGDTINAYDWGAQRVTTFDALGRTIGTVRLEAGEVTPGQYIGRAADGSHLARPSGGLRELEELGGGVVLRGGEVVRFGVDGRLVAPLFEYRSGYFQTVQIDGRAAGIFPAFAPVGSVALAGQHVVVGWSESYELRYFDLEGNLIRLVRRSHEPIPVTEEEEAVARERMGTQSAFGDALAQMLMVRDTHPAYGAILTNPAGEVWVEATGLGDSDGEKRWSVFGPDGVWITEIETPGDLTVQEAGPDFVLGVWRGEYDVEYVRAYRIVKPAG